MRSKEILQKILTAREKKNAGLLHASLEMQTSSHFPMLIKVIQASNGIVAELGTGLFSTPLLHWLCLEKKRGVISYENYKHYFDFALLFKADFHEIVRVVDWDKQEYLEHYGVVFIDHSIPRRAHTRGDDALLFKDKADFVVLHDAGPDSNPKYGYEKIYPLFKYRHDFLVENAPATTVLSNSKNLEFLC